MHPRSGQAPGGREGSSGQESGSGSKRGGRGGRVGGPGRGSQDWRLSQAGPDGGYGDRQEGSSAGGAGSSGGDGWRGGRRGRGYAGGRGSQGSGARGGGYGGDSQYGSQGSGARGGGYVGDSQYGSRGSGARGGYSGEPGYEGRGQWRGGQGGRRGGRGTPYRDQHTASSSSSGPPPPFKDLLPGFTNLSINEPGPSGQVVEEEGSSSSGFVPEQHEGDVYIPEDATEAVEVPITSRGVLVAPKRPQPGRAGSRAMVRVNHFVVNFRPGVTIYHYDVDINPKVSSRSIARRLQRQLLAMHETDFQERLPAYDGSKSLYTAGPLPFESKEFTVAFTNENREKSFKITLRHVGTLGSSALNEFLAGRKIAAPQELLQALDVALREALMHPPYTPFSRSFFTETLGSVALDGGLTAWNGFFQSLRPTAQGLVLNVDLATTAFYKSMPVVEFLQQKVRNFNPGQGLTDAQRTMVKKALARLKVEVCHRPTPRKYRIFGLSPSPTKDLKFSVNEGEEIGIIEYFRETYNWPIRYPELPCLQVQASRTSYLPMEVCKISEGQKFMGKLVEQQTTKLRTLACVKPPEREGKLKAIMAGANGPGRGQYVASFGMSVSPELTSVNARVLRPPKLKYGVQGSVREIEPRTGSWNMNNACLVEGGTIDHWALISFDRSVHPAVAGELITNLAHRCQELGIRMNPETVIPPYMGRREDLEGGNLERCLKNVCGKASQEIANRSQSKGGLLQLLVCIIGEKHPAYGDLKRICETQLGVVTQCCLSKNIKRYNSQYLANLGLKINAKVGGKNNTLAVALPDLCSVFKRPTIIFGADVTHPNPGDDSSPSIAALVANVDWPSAIKYVASVRSQPHREEMIEKLSDMVIELWRKFCDKTGVRPERIIMFRDGVSEGQFDKVLQCEVHALKEAMQKAGGSGYNPLITWVVVQKRHHTRLYPADNNRDKSGNVLPGTVVDSTIVHPREFDFFLCSHAGIQGTSKPTHYHVLWDENSFSADDLQGLINNLCYTYVRCTRSVSIVPPAYYAHLAAYRARLYIEGSGGSDTASYTSGQPSSVGSGGRNTRAGAPQVRALPQIARNVQEVMYFC
ncbi:hypothetical protein L7F22_064572 [Adiantum nelumboides]|nr:hypothetical protein [Adiantum nelumboides]